MAARLGWADAVAGAPSYTGRALRQLGSVLFGGSTAARPLGAFSGVSPGTPSTIVTATSTTWTVTPFPGVIDGATAAIAGPYPYAFDTDQTGSVTAAGGSARVDRLDVQVVDPAEGGVGGANPLIQIVYTVGTPGLAAAPAQSHSLAKINVPASGNGAPTVTWVAPYCVAAGGIQPIPAGVYPASPYLGQYVDDPVLGLVRFDGTIWAPRKALAVLSFNGTAFTPANGASTVVTNAYLTTTKIVGMTTATGTIVITTAGDYWVAGQVQFVGNGTGIRQIQINRNSTTAATNLLAQGITTPTSAAAITTACRRLVTLAAGDVLRMFVAQNSGGTLAVDNSGNALPATYFEVVKA